MAGNTKQEAGPDEMAGTKQVGKPKRAKNKKALVKKVLQNIGTKIENNELKPTVGDFIRLLQLEKELLEETPKEIKVSWVESDKKEHVPGE